jgi:hypothetical protein
VTQTVEDFIAQSGVKGMKWGVRRKRSAPVSKAGKTKYSKSPHRLSDADLAKRIKRLEMEKRYSDLNRAEVTKGKKFTSDTLNTVGKQVIGTIAGAAVMIAIGAAIGKTSLGKKNPNLAKNLTKIDPTEVFGKPKPAS